MAIAGLERAAVILQSENGAVLLPLIRWTTRTREAGGGMGRGEAMRGEAPHDRMIIIRTTTTDTGHSILDTERRAVRTYSSRIHDPPQFHLK